MKKLIVLTAGLALLIPSLAFADSFSLKLGYYLPRGVSNSYLTQHVDTSLWGIEFDQMTFAPKDFRGGIFGLSYERFLGPNFSFVLGVESFSRRRLGDYYDYDQTEFTDDTWFAFPVDEEPPTITDWYYVSHSFRVSSAPVTASVKFAPLGRKTKFIPYVGGGVGLYFFSAGIFGETIDFSRLDQGGNPLLWYYDYETDSAYSNPLDPALQDVEIFPVASINSRERGMAVGYHAFVGLQFPIGYRATIDAEARYHWAKGKFNDGYLVDFEDFELGGLAVSIGFTYWF
jgi:opacity protein-like surface antigen